MFQVFFNNTENAAVILSKSNCARSSVGALREWYWWKINIPFGVTVEL